MSPLPSPAHAAPDVTAETTQTRTTARRPMLRSRRPTRHLLAASVATFLSKYFFVSGSASASFAPTPRGSGS